MLSARLADVDSTLLENVVADRWLETATLEFKAQLTGREQQDKHEFAKDVTGLANADGGDLVYGIRADDEGALGLAPLAGIAADREKMRLGQILDSQVALASTASKCGK